MGTNSLFTYCPAPWSPVLPVEVSVRHIFQLGEEVPNLAGSVFTLDKIQKVTSSSTGAVFKLPPGGNSLW